MKKFIIISIILSLLFSLSLFVSADDSSGFYSIDADTHGNWVGVYGSDGYFIAGDSNEASTWQLPDYASLSFTTLFGSDPGYWTWYDSTADTEVPEAELAVTGNAPYTDKTATARRASCVYNTDGVDAVITLTKEAYVTVYSADYDNPYNNSEARECFATLYNEKMDVIAEYEMHDFQAGLYFTFKAPAGTTTFEISTLSGANSVISAVFFDTTLGATESDTTAEISTEANVESTAEIDQPTVETVVNAPQTGDTIWLVVLLMVSAIGILLSREKIKIL